MGISPLARKGGKKKPEGGDDEEKETHHFRHPKRNEVKSKDSGMKQDPSPLPDSSAQDEIVRAILLV